MHPGWCDYQRACSEPCCSVANKCAGFDKLLCKPTTTDKKGSVIRNNARHYFELVWPIITSTLVCVWQFLENNWKHYDIDYRSSAAEPACSVFANVRFFNAQIYFVLGRVRKGRVLRLRCRTLIIMGILAGGVLVQFEPTRATIEVHHIFPEVPRFGSLLRPLPKTDLEKNENAAG